MKKEVIDKTLKEICGEDYKPKIVTSFTEISLRKLMGTMREIDKTKLDQIVEQYEEIKGYTGEEFAVGEALTIFFETDDGYLKLKCLELISKLHPHEFL